MKKLFFLTIMALLTIPAAKAQMFLGGGLSFYMAGGNTESNNTTVDKAKMTVFNFKPMAGYMVSDQFYIGAGIDLGIAKSNTPGTPDNTIVTSTSFGIIPFARYYALRLDKFAIFGQGQLGLSMSGSKTKVGSTSTDGPKIKDIGLGVFPGIGYNVNENLEISAALNFINFGFSHSVEKIDAGGGQTNYDRSNYFGFGANMGSIITTNRITLEVLYRF